jgi:hypothetical protein
MGRPRKLLRQNIEMLSKMANEGKTDKEIALALKVSERTIVRYRLYAGKIRKKGGYRPGAGRKRKDNELLRQQSIDCRINSFEVGIGKKRISDEDWVRWQPDAFSYHRGGVYVRREDAPAGVPAYLPRVYVSAETIFAKDPALTAQAFDAVKGGGR